MNNRGFTLIELLAVIVILTSISLTAVFGINAALERREEKECQEEIALAENAAKIYFSLNSSETSVTVDKLLSNGYLNEKKIKRLDKNEEISNDLEYKGDCN